MQNTRARARYHITYRSKHQLAKKTKKFAKQMEELYKAEGKEKVELSNVSGNSTPLL